MEFGLICRAKRVLNVKTLCTLYYSFVYPYLNYAAEVWADSTANHIVPVVRLQKKILRIINRSQKFDHTAPLFRSLKILRLEKIHFLKVALIMFKVFHKLTPLVFHDLFTRNTDVHSYNTRQRAYFHVPISKTHYMSRAISVKGVHIWNKLLENSFNYDCSFISYKISLKKYLIQNPDIIAYTW